MRCTATTKTGTQCKRNDQRCNLAPPHPLCREHRLTMTHSTCIYFLPKERRYCKSVVEPCEQLCRYHSIPGMFKHVQWERLPLIVWANVTKWLNCKARRVARRTSKAFAIRYRFHQCSCLKQGGQMMRNISNARFDFWNNLLDCVLTYNRQPQLSDAWAVEPHERRLTSHYATWIRQLKRAYDHWSRLVRSFRHLHSMYDGDIPHEALNTHAFPHDEFTVIEDVDKVRVHNHRSFGLPSTRFHTDSGNVVPTVEFMMLLYDQLRSDWGAVSDTTIAT
jgi:hypothetical protein